MEFAQPRGSNKRTGGHDTSTGKTLRVDNSRHGYSMMQAGHSHLIRLECFLILSNIKVLSFTR